MISVGRGLSPRPVAPMKRRELLKLLLDNSVWIIIAIFFILNALFTPKFFTVLNFRNILIHSSILGIVVIGESFCLLSGHLDLSVESTLALSAVLGAMSVKNALPVPLAVCIMLASGMLVGFANGALVRKLGLNAFVATLITYIGIRGTALGIVEGKTIWNLPTSLCFFGAGTIGVFPVQIVLLAVLYLLFHAVLVYTRFGRHVYLVGDNQTAARISGINVDRVVITVFMLSGLLSAFAGLVMAGRLNSASPLFGTGMVFEAMSAAIIGGISLRGGIGSLSMALGGVLLLSAISNVLNLHAVSPYWIQTIRALMILFAVALDSLKRRLMRYEE